MPAWRRRATPRLYDYGSRNKKLFLHTRQLPDWDDLLPCWRAFQQRPHNPLVDLSMSGEWVGVMGAEG